MEQPLVFLWSFVHWILLMFDYRRRCLLWMLSRIKVLVSRHPRFDFGQEVKTRIRSQKLVYQYSQRLCPSILLGIPLSVWIQCIYIRFWFFSLFIKNDISFSIPWSLSPDVLNAFHCVNVPKITFRFVVFHTLRQQHIECIDCNH